MSNNCGLDLCTDNRGYVIVKYSTEENNIHKINIKRNTFDNWSAPVQVFRINQRCKKLKARTNFQCRSKIVGVLLELARALIISSVRLS